MARVDAQVLDPLTSSAVAPAALAPVQARLARWLTPLGTALPPVYLVGGAVRDLLLGRLIKDIDLMTADPARLGRWLADRHNAAFVPFVNKADTPCYRVADRGDAADFIDLVPIHGDSVQADLVARDFTVNAMAMVIAPGGNVGRLIDPLNGRADLRDRCVRMGSATAFAADPLRMLRAIRFAAVLGFTIDPATLDRIRLDSPRIGAVAAERIWAELALLLGRHDGAAWIRLLDDLGLLAVILPEVVSMKGCTQNDHHHLDVWQHSLAVLQKADTILADLDAWPAAVAALNAIFTSASKHLAFKLAALLHDVGKPATRAVDRPTGRATFLGHEAQGARLVEAVARRLRLPGLVRETAVLLVANHIHVLFLSEPQVKPATLARWFRRLGDDMVLAIALSMADVLSTLGPTSDPARRQDHVRWCGQAITGYVTELKPRLTAKALVSGKDLIAMGMAPGPRLGQILNQLRQAQDAGQITDRQEALALAARLCQDRATPPPPADDHPPPAKEQ